MMWCIFACLRRAYSVIVLPLRLIGKRARRICIPLNFSKRYWKSTLSTPSKQNDIFGAAVHTANRMTSQAKARQIVISGGTVEKMEPDLQKQTRQIDVATVRGKLDEVALYEFLWNPEEATSMLPTIEWENHSRKASKIVLSFRDQNVEVHDKRKSVIMGRAEDNDLVIKGNLISRIHAKIEMRRGKFMLVDQSTNGTFVQNVQGEEIFVRRDSTELTGEGTIGLGKAEEPGGSLAIHYKAVE